MSHSSFSLPLAALLLTTTPGCSRKSDSEAPPPAGTAGTAATQTESSPYGKLGDPVQLSVGYQPYYSEAWSAVVMNGLSLWKKYLPPQSTVEFNVGLQGAIIVNAMLAGKEQIGYCGDMPAIVGATKREVADLRIVANIGLSHDQCNVFLTRKDAPRFANAAAAVHWLDGKTVAVPKGSCADRFALAVFKKQGVAPKEYLNQSIELITSGFRVKKLDAAVVWEPVASRLVLGDLATRVATGNDFGENDSAFIDMREDLIATRPDVAKGWMQAELDAELFLADPKNMHEVVRMAKEQTTGFEEPVLSQALFGVYSASVGGGATRIEFPFTFSPQALDLLRRSAAFLFEAKSISVAELPADAVVPRFVDEVLTERGLHAPVGEIQGSAAAGAQ
jgi:NitT/TauT family transport system substrate-binding protein